jgi:phosphoribosylformimino-5-aminoimidazole carboxamide ribonucleotide (ProFAR) isomerase
MCASNNKKDFLEIPAVSIYNGKIVIAHEGKYETLTIDNKIPDTLDLLEIITENYETVYIIDVNGLLENKPQLDLLKKTIDFCEVWLDAGISEADYIYDPLVAGAQEVILSSKTLGSLMELARAFELSENIIFEIDYDNGVISPSIQISDMTPAKLGQEINDIGITKIIFADYSRIQMDKSIETSIIKELLIQRFEVYVGGGVKIRDIDNLKKLQISGAIVELVDVLKYGKVDF